MVFAAREAVATGDGSALMLVAEAVQEAITAGRADELPELAALAADAARDADRPDEGLTLIAEILREVQEEASGSVLVRRASLWGYLRRYERRSRDLRAAAAAFAAASDREGACRVLADLALPVDADMSLAQRAEIGMQALDMARSLERSDLSALCATNVAITKMLAGDRSALELRPYLEAHLPTRTDTEEGRLAIRNWLNWANAAFAIGLHDEVDRAQRVVAIAPDTGRKKRIRVTEAAVHWRRGDWDAARRICVELSDAPLNSEDVATLRFVQGAMDFQRFPMMKPNGLAAAADSILDEDPWGAIARAVVIDVRVERREPRPARGLVRLIQRIKTMGIRAGWEDLLPAVGRASPEAHRQVVGMLGTLTPQGARAEASMLAGEGFAGLHGRPDEAAQQLESAGDAFEELGEPFPAARCRESAAEARNRAGRHAGDLWRKAASIYRELGADRALAGLLRRAHGTRALSGFSVPAAYRRAPSAGLTRREQEIADLARRGYTVPAMADSMTLSPHTIATHLKHIRQKLQVGSKAELIRLLSED